MLTADDYGFHHGDVWYRGRYTGAATAGQVSLRYGGGGGRAAAGLAGRHLPRPERAAPRNAGLAGHHRHRDVRPSRPALRTAGSHVLSVMVRNDGHNEDGGVNDAHKEGRGLIAVDLTDADAAAADRDLADPGQPRAARTSPTRSAAR